MSFSPASLDFLFEVCSRNDRAWYHENKPLYQQVLQEPMEELTEALKPYMEKIDPLLGCRISRIYRDARMLSGRPYFRDHIWCTFGKSRDLYHGLPSFFFEINPGGFRYGFGYYYTARESVEAIRDLILRNDSSWQAALSAFEKQSSFSLVGDMYKRNHYPDQPENVGAWLNRRDMCLIAESSDLDLLFSENLAKTIGEDFIAISPVYDFWMKCESLWRE